MSEVERLLFVTLKVELVYRTEFVTRKSARTAVFDYIETFYHRRRRHSSLGYVSRTDFENQAAEHAAFAA